jgi:hypothetical protein
MDKPKVATVHLKFPPAVRDRLSGKLRQNGLTMQGFLTEVCQRIIVDEAFFELAKAQPAQKELTS